MELNKIYNEECLQGMSEIPDSSIDMILCDLPYAKTKNSWDVLIPMDELWEQYNRIIKENGAIVLTAIEPFTSKLVLSNVNMYRHKWIWNKNNSAGFANARFMPFQICEDVLVFSKKKVNYYPIMEERGKPRNKGGYSKSTNYIIDAGKANTEKNNLYYPKNLLEYSNASQKGKIHPTQKPVGLFEYLINTYTKEGDTVLDNCMGSGTTAIACMNINRNYIGFELDKEYYIKALERIEKHKEELHNDKHEKSK